MTPKSQLSYRERLRRCACCPRRCRVNRLAGELGFCRVGADLHVCHLGLHFGEEPPISGVRGSGTVFFAGCNLRCVFCQNHQISQGMAVTPRPNLTTTELASELLRLQAAGAHNINFVSPSHMLWQMAETIELAKATGLRIPVVYNSNGYDSLAALRQIRGLIDIYLPDLKYLDPELGRHYSAVSDYPEVVPEVLAEMLEQVGHLQMDAEGIATRGLLVRHLVLPNHPENSELCLDFLAKLDVKVFVSIMAQYSPQHRASDYPLLSRPLRASEYEAITEYALARGLENAFIQELASQEHYLPRFEREQPFELQKNLCSLSGILPPG